MRQHRRLRICRHRRIMAALSKLVSRRSWRRRMACYRCCTEAAGGCARGWRGRSELCIDRSGRQQHLRVHQVDAPLVTDVKSPIKVRADSAFGRSLSPAQPKAIESPTDRKVFGSQMSAKAFSINWITTCKSATKALNVLAMQIEKLIENPAPVPRTSGPVRFVSLQPNHQLVPVCSTRHSGTPNYLPDRLFAYIGHGLWHNNHGRAANDSREILFRSQIRKAGSSWKHRFTCHGSSVCNRTFWP